MLAVPVKWGPGMRISSWLAPTVALAAMFAIGNVGWAVAAAYSLPLRPGFLFLYFLGVQWAIAWWVVVDSRRHGLGTSIDHGWFVFFAWPVALPYHLIKTRRIRGCLVLAGMIALFVASYLLAVVVFLILGS